MSSDTRERALFEVLSVYSPLLSVMAGFYFAERVVQAAPKLKHGSFTFAVAITSFWCIAPFVVYAGSKNVDEAMHTFELLRPFGDFLACGGVTFYFANRSA